MKCKIARALGQTPFRQFQPALRNRHSSPNLRTNTDLDHGPDPMKLAFSTVACPKWDFETIASRAKEYGYDGVEIRGFLNEQILTASNIFLTDPKKLRDLFKYHAIEIACLSSSIAATGHKKHDRQMSDDCRR